MPSGVYDLPDGERKLRASMGGHATWARTVDRRARATHAQRGIYLKFLRETDDSLPDDVRAKMAESAYRAYMKGLVLRSVVARRKRKEQQQRDAAAMRAARDAEVIGGDYDTA